MFSLYKKQTLLSPLDHHFGTSFMKWGPCRIRQDFEIFDIMKHNDIVKNMHYTERQKTKTKKAQSFGYL